MASRSTAPCPPSYGVWSQRAPTGACGCRCVLVERAVARGQPSRIAQQLPPRSDVSTGTGFRRHFCSNSLQSPHIRLLTASGSATQTSAMLAAPQATATRTGPIYAPVGLIVGWPKGCDTRSPSHPALTAATAAASTRISLKRAYAFTGLSTAPSGTRLSCQTKRSRAPTNIERTMPRQRWRSCLMRSTGFEGPRKKPFALPKKMRPRSRSIWLRMPQPGKLVRVAWRVGRRGLPCFADQPGLRSDATAVARTRRCSPK